MKSVVTTLSSQCKKDPGDQRKTDMSCAYLMMVTRCFWACIVIVLSCTRMRLAHPSGEKQRSEKKSKTGQKTNFNKHNNWKILNLFSIDIKT